MTRFFRIILPVFAFVVFANAFAAPDATAQNILGEVLKRMDNHNKNLTSLKASVTMVKHNAQLGDDEITIGTAIYRPRAKKDPLVRIDWTKPDESLAVVNKQYIIYRPRLGQAYKGSTDSAKGNAKAGGALAFMNMSRAELRANYEVAYLGEGTLSNGTKTVHLQMTPKARTNYKLAEVWVDADGMPVQSKITEHNNDTTTVLLTNLRKNETIDAKAFHIELPKGTKIVQA